MHFDPGMDLVISTFAAYTVGFIALPNDKWMIPKTEVLSDKTPKRPLDM